MQNQLPGIPKTGVSQSILSGVKKGISQITMREVLKACMALNYEIWFVKVTKWNP